MSTNGHALQHFAAGRSAVRSCWPVGLTAEPSLGAHLVTPRAGYTHHGIYVGDGNVIHYSGLSRSRHAGPVEEVSVTEFACGNPVSIVEHAHDPYSGRQIVRRARSRLGERNFRLLTNNCEHFCNWCVSGCHRSEQVERLGFGHALRVAIACECE